MSRKILERSVRAWVARGAGIDSSKVIPGRQTANAPDGLYASVTMRDETPMGMQGHQQRVGENSSFTIDVQLLMTNFDIQFFREGAIEAANRFAMWARSETGITWAATSLTCGRLSGVNIYDGGRSYVNGSEISFPHNAGDDEPNNTAVGAIETNATGSITGAYLTRGGSGYSTLPSMVISGSGTDATGAPRGYGFSVGRIKIRNLSEIESAEYEERAQVELDINHHRVYNDLDSGRVETIAGRFPSNGFDINIGNELGVADMGGLNYIYQKNLIPSGLPPANFTLADHSGIGLQRLIQWQSQDVANTGTTGIVEETLLNEASIAPDHGRDLLAQSPFITNYEGNVLYTSGPYSEAQLGTSSDTAIVYIKTTHRITGVPVNIVSVRAVVNPISRSGSGSNTQITTDIDLSRFNSMTMLSAAQPDGGTIGLQIQIGLALTTNLTPTNVLLLLQTINQNNTIPANLRPAQNIIFLSNGNNTRVTFLQHTLA